MHVSQRYSALPVPCSSTALEVGLTSKSSTQSMMDKSAVPRNETTTVADSSSYPANANWSEDKGTLKLRQHEGAVLPSFSAHGTNNGASVQNPHCHVWMEEAGQ
jgi:hypothetical protein